MQYDPVDAEAGEHLPVATSVVRGGDWKLFDRATPTARTVPLAVGQTDATGAFNACYPATR